ncbi:MAG: DNA-3-methyladenine glycosylase 2 family protein [Gemmatimonadota bacterium]
MTDGGLDVVWTDATERLRDDPAFGPLVEEVGPVRIRRPGPEHFPLLCRSIVYQQLAGRAASTIHGRFVDAVGGEVRPATVLGVEEDELRAAGLSKNKVRAVRDLAQKVASGEVLLDGIEGRTDEEVATALTRVWGVGRWTADMFLLFQLRRADVWPTGDLGVRNGFARVMGWDEAPSAGELELAGIGYRPWRSAVAWYCWRAVEVLTPGG